MKQLTTLLAIYTIFLNAAHADVTEYDLELIIFEDTSGRYANSEQWQHELPEPTAESTTTTTSSTSTPSNNEGANAVLNISPIKGIGLDRYAKKLKANKRYNVLVHKAWRQTGLADDAAIDIPIDSRQTNTATGSAAPDPGMKSSQNGDANNIHGTIKIVLGRYLHIYTDMIYQQPRKDAAPLWHGDASQQYMEYPINFHRRMRSKELHYLDHPMVGILVMAKPVKNEEAPQDNT